MNIKHVLIVGVCVALLVVGWFSLAFTGNETGDQLREHTQKVEQADRWHEAGLYQRAIKEYQKALDIVEVQETRTKMLASYELRLKEDKKLIDSYLAQLETSVLMYPTTLSYVETLAIHYKNQGMIKKLYDTLVYVLNSGVEDEGLEKLKLETQYIGYVKGEEFEYCPGYSGGVYAARNGGVWSELTAGGSIRLAPVYEYVGPSGDDGARVLTNQKDSRLVTGEDFVLGIFEKKITAAGIYSEGLIPAVVNEKYGYYDEFAKEVFGGFDMAGMFKNGLAPVQKDGKWFFVNKSGEKVSEEYKEILMDANGCWLSGTVFVAVDKDGKYGIYTTEWKRLSDEPFDRLDLCVSDGWIAFEKNGKWGFVDIHGEVKIEAKYEKAKSFSNGLAAVCKNGKWGFITQKEELVIPYQYYDADYFNEKGSCIVKITETLKTDDKNSDDKLSKKEQLEVDENNMNQAQKENKAKYRLFVLELGIKER